MSRVPELFLNRATIARLASTTVGKVDRAIGAGTWQVLGSGERIASVTAARSTVAHLLPAHTGDEAARLARADELLAPYVSAPAMTATDAAARLNLTRETVEGQLAANLLPSVYRRARGGFEQRVASGAAGLGDAATGARQLTKSPVRSAKTAAATTAAAPAAPARPSRAPKVSATTSGSAAAKAPAATGDGAATKAPRRTPAAPTEDTAPPTKKRHPVRTVLVAGGGLGAAALGVRVMQRMNHDSAASADAKDGAAADGTTAKAIGTDTTKTQATVDKLDPKSDQGRRARIALLALQEADRGAMTVTENGALNPRVKEYIAASEGAKPTSDRSWSGDFAAWVTKDIAPIGYGGKGAKDLIEISSWAGNAGAKVSKDKRAPQVGDIVMLDTFRNETEIDAYAIVTAVNGSKMTVVQGDDGGELRRVDYDTSDRSVLGYIDPVAAKAIAAPPADDDSDHIDAGSPSANKPAPPPPAPKAPAPAPAPPRDPNRAGSAWAGAALTSKSQPVTPEQRDNMRLVLEKGHEMGVSERVLKAAIATIIVETNSINLPNGDLDSVGLFQQRNSWGSFEERHDPKLAAEKFLVRARNIEARYPDIAMGVLAQSVQVSAYPERYAQHEGEAAAAVQAFAAP